MVSRSVRMELRRICQRAPSWGGGARASATVGAVASPYGDGYELTLEGPVKMKFPLIEWISGNSEIFSPARAFALLWSRLGGTLTVPLYWTLCPCIGSVCTHDRHERTIDCGSCQIGRTRSWRLSNGNVKLAQRPKAIRRIMVSSISWPRNTSQPLLPHSPPGIQHQE